jgi:hypothetical protein
MCQTVEALTRGHKSQARLSPYSPARSLKSKDRNDGVFSPNTLLKDRTYRAGLSADGVLQTVRKIKNANVGSPPRDLQAPKFHQLWGPPVAVLVGYEYKCARGKDRTIFIVLVSKGWDILLEIQSIMRKDKSQAETVF